MNIAAPSTELVPNQAFAELASEERIQKAAAALEQRGMQVTVVDDEQQARQAVLDRLPEGAEVYTNVSQTLEQIGVLPEIDASGKYVSVRAKMAQLDRKTQGAEIRALRGAPQIIVGSVHAITEDGRVLVASNGGSQLAPYAYSAQQVIWVVGAQKLVGDLDEGFRRIEEYSYPLEDARLREAFGIPSAIGKTLIIDKEITPGRVQVILVRKELGF